MKKQIRLYDLYRCAVIKQESNIKNIEHYSCTADCKSVTVEYSGYISGPKKRLRVKYKVNDESELRSVVKQINQTLGNTHEIKGGR